MRPSPGKSIGLCLTLGLLPAGLARAGGPSCSTRVATLEDTIHFIESREPSKLTLAENSEFDPPQGTRGPLIDGPMIFVEYKHSRMRLEGDPIEDQGTASARAKALGSVAAKRKQSWAILHPGEKEPERQPVAILFDRALPAREAVDFLAALGTNYDIRLLTVGTKTIPPQHDYPPRVREKLKAIDAGPQGLERIRVRSDATGEALAGCPGHERYFEKLGDESVDIPERERRLHAAFVAALKNCACGTADVEMIDALLLTSVDLTPPVHVLATGGVAAKAPVLSLPKTASAQDLVTQIPAGARFSVRWTKASGK